MNLVPNAAKKIISTLRLGELSLVDEPCIPGSEIEIVKNKGGPGDDAPDAESVDKSLEVEVSPGGEALEELVEKALMPFHGLLNRLSSGEIGIAQFQDASAAELAVLTEAAKTGDTDIHKSAASSAKQIVLENVMTLQELQAKAAELQTRVESATAETTVQKNRADAAEARAVAAEAALAAANETIEKAKPRDEEEILKSLPEAIRNELVAGRQAREAAALETEIVKARSFGVAEPEVVAKAMLSLRALDAESTTVIEKALSSVKAANDGAEKILKNLGVTKEVLEDDPEAELDAKAEEIVKAKGVSKAEAIVQATAADPSLYERIQKRRKVA